VVLDNAQERTPPRFRDFWRSWCLWQSGAGAACGEASSQGPAAKALARKWGVTPSHQFGWLGATAQTYDGSTMPGRLEELAELIRRKNAIDAAIAAIVGRPAQMGHVGEFVAAEIFGTLLEHSASTRSIDGYFATAPLAGRSVNITWYGKQEGLLDLARDYPPDYYLVLTGPKGLATSSQPR
jgi:hypothetical protein